MAGQYTTSLAIIARDEAAALPVCLGSVRQLFDEIVVIDTGSQDATIEVARTLGATVVEFPWQDDFSAARNLAFSRCGGDFIFWMDADEILIRPARVRLERFLRRSLSRNRAYIMNHVSGRVDGRIGFSVSLSPRLLPNHAEVKWERRVYEQVLPSVRMLGLRTTYLDIDILHRGFDTPGSVVEKLTRNKALVELELAENANDALATFNLARTHFDLAMCTRDLDSCRTALRHVQALPERLAGKNRDYLGPRTCALLAACHLTNSDRMCAIETCVRARKDWPRDIGLIALEASLLHDLGMWKEAEKLYEGIGKLERYSDMKHHGNNDYLHVVSALVEFAYLLERIGNHYKACAIWSDLVKDSGGRFDASYGLRRTAGRILRDAIHRPGTFVRGIGQLYNWGN